jgi:hypothetical protein
VELNIHTPSNLAIPLLHIHPRETLFRVHKEAHTRIFATALRVVIRSWRNQNVTYVDEMYYMSTAVKNNNVD